MSSFVVSDALAAGLKEGFKIGIVWLVLSAYLDLRGLRSLMRPFYAGVAAVAVVSVISFFVPGEIAGREQLGGIIAMSFAFILMLSGASLLNASGVRLFPASPGVFSSPPFLLPAMFLGTVLFFMPDSMGSVYYLREIAVMKETGLRTFVSAFLGAAAAAGGMYGLSLFVKPGLIGSFFGLPQLILLLAVVKLLGGGTGGLSELSLIPAVQKGVMKFVHDAVHQTFVLLMVPDHPLLKTTVWNFVGFFFGPNFGSLCALLILVFIPLLFIRESLFSRLPEPPAASGAEKRKILSGLLSERRRKALPVIIFIVFILSAWFSRGGEIVSELYDPKPKPVVDDKGEVLIPFTDPTMDLRDGELHKFSLSAGGEEIRIMVIMRPDNRLAVCLDACEICPPKGYGRKEDNVVCIYCNTPIPVMTLGAPGGCNPIPLSFTADDRFLRIEVPEILKKWEFVKTGRSREGVH